MTYPHGGAGQIWRAGSTVPHNPNKAQIRDWGLDMEGRVVAIEAAVTGTARYTRDTLLDLNAVSNPTGGDSAYVLDDFGNTGTYEYFDSTWSRVADLPASLSDFGILREDLDLLAKVGRNLLPHSDFSDGTVAGLTLSNQSDIPQLPGWVAAHTGSATLGFPASALVDDFWWAQSQRSRAVKATMVRSNGAVDTTDLQLRQSFEIPEALRDLAEVEISFVYNYLVHNEGIAVFSAGLWLADNAAISGADYTSWARVNDRVIGEVGTAMFQGTFDTTGKTHIQTGPRLRAQGPAGGEGAGVSDINEDAWIGPCAVFFEQAGRGEWSPSEDDEGRQERNRVLSGFVERISRPATQIGNAINNGALIEVGSEGSIPPGWATLSGGGGAKAGGWRVVDLPDLPSVIDANGFEVDHDFDGTFHTDRQFQQIIPLPSRLWDASGTTVTFVQYAKLDAGVTSQVVIVPEDLMGVTVGSLAYLSGIAEDVGNGWAKIVYSMGVEVGVRQLDIRFRTSASTGAGVTTGLKSHQSLFGLVFNAPDYVSDYEPNLWDDARRLARAEIKADRAEMGGLTRSDFYADAVGNFLQVLPDSDVVILGDSQTDSYEDEVLSAISDRATIEGGIGGEWVSTHILNRMRGHALDDLPIFSAASTYRLRTKRAVPDRCISEIHRAEWTVYGQKIAEPKFVEFYNANGLIGRSYDQERAVVTVSGAMLSDATGHPFVNGDEVYVLQDSIPGNMYRAKPYYVRDVSGGSFGLAEFSGGAAISFDAFGGSIAILGGFYLDWAWNGVVDTSITVRTFTDWSEKTIILNGGTNDIGQGLSASVICAAYDAIAAEQRSLAKRIVFETIPGFWNAAGDWEAGGNYHTEMVDVHNYIKRRYPDMVADSYAALLAAGDGSANDNADVALGLVPRSLRSSATDGHTNSEGNAVRAQVIATLIRRLSW